MREVFPKSNQSKSRLTITRINKAKEKRTNGVSFKTAAHLFLAINSDLQYSNVASSVIPILGDKPVGEISLEDINHYVEARRKIADDRTIGIELRFMALVFKLGIGKV